MPPDWRGYINRTLAHPKVPIAFWRRLCSFLPEQASGQGLAYAEPRAAARRLGSTRKSAISALKIPQIFHCSDATTLQANKQDTEMRDMSKLIASFVAKLTDEEIDALSKRMIRSLLEDHTLTTGEMDSIMDYMSILAAERMVRSNDDGQ